MDQSGPSSNFLPGGMSTDKFGSLTLGRAYIDTVRGSIGTLGGGELLNALERLERAYDQFPELELDRPRHALLDSLQSTAENLPDRAAIPLLIYCVAAGRPCSSALGSLVEKIVKSDFQPLLPAVLRSLVRGRLPCWSAIAPVVGLLRQQGRTDTALQLISEVLACTQLATAADVAELGDVLRQLLENRRQPVIDSAVLARAAVSARARLSHPSSGRGGQASRKALLATAERLRLALSPARLSPHPEPDLAWSSALISFDEFLLQWPCETELPSELNDAEFIEEVYRAILLRGPDITERDQYLRLLEDGIVSKYWIIEDLLTSAELGALERRVRVIYGGKVITGLESSEEEKTPVVTWPWSAGG
jgi:hypothetical protein